MPKIFFSWSYLLKKVDDRCPTGVRRHPQDVACSVISVSVLPIGLTSFLFSDTPLHFQYITGKTFLSRYGCRENRPPFLCNLNTPKLRQISPYAIYVGNVYFVYKNHKKDPRPFGYGSLETAMPFFTACLPAFPRGTPCRC